ncbi:hypothetical protein A3B61_01265 [Candidatus Peribacteria bacterium RIFCSPLOWO2_01_FULL_53_10]|nr:MAG: hypothetical protein A3B61_01265 [Candidatus Peribacteria bacterium RIFCSPLOWO2_01_FULL_53_10]
MQGKCHDINSVSLSVQKFLPSREQILYGNDMLVRMKLPPSALSLSLSLSRKALRLSIESKRDI